MSDIRSAPPAPENKKVKNQEGVLVNANIVLQRALNQLSSENRSQIVLRCDELPLVKGAEDDYQKVFSGLLQMILQKKKDVPKLYLHIHCTTAEQKVETSGMSKEFSIQFNTNIDPCMNWLLTHNQQINKIAAILHRNGGSLAVNQTRNASCIFSVSLPGKTL